ncbi:presilphiperfolan-8-beta-ol synthase [Fusarium denticulatum]|uniref:Terpene synthase n=1 Tax=Fusarium denticulatum TaxID=48507 RepID=A0A8H5U9R9_9HYPO|nr:presilphiperfolan-8-beta-ol synthase [Fusarium denticulatum]
MVKFDSGSESEMTNGDEVHINTKHEVKSRMANGNGVHNVPGHDQFQDRAEMEVLILPDLFSSLMSVPARENPHYASVKADADEWISSVINADAKWASRNKRVDFTYLASIWAPDCSAFALRTSADWNSWAFLFDDQFDEGHLCNDLDGAINEIARTREIMEGIAPRYTADSEYPIRYVFQTLCDRVKQSPEGFYAGKPSSGRFYRRWMWAHELYWEGLVAQVRTNVEGRSFTRDPDEYLAMRRGSLGAYPALVNNEWAYGIDLPEEVAAHPLVFEIMVIISDQILLVNDILSYEKDLRLGVDHNMVRLLKAKGLSTQQAINEVGVMINDCYRRYYRALSELPCFGEEADRALLGYLEVEKNHALGSLLWSYKTGRYFKSKEDGARVRKTRELLIPKAMAAL